MPRKSKPPISASTLAAVTAVMPKSWHSGMKCVPIRPLVDRPQTKKVKNSSQNVRVRPASVSAVMASRAALPAAARSGGAVTARSPNGAQPEVARDGRG